jgi:hypothetical protein
MKREGLLVWWGCCDARVLHGFLPRRLWPRVWHEKGRVVGLVRLWCLSSSWFSAEEIVAEGLSWRGKGCWFGEVGVMLS